jgi:hypothetical protein
MRNFLIWVFRLGFIFICTGCQLVDNTLGSLVGIVPPPDTALLQFPATHPVPFHAKHATYLQRWDGKQYVDFYLKGVNLGVGIPGSQAGDLAVTREQYARWFKRMGEVGFNNLRIYTLHPPHFYEELARYNQSHPERPLYLFHGVWIEEDGHRELYQATAEFERNIREAVDAVHGRLTLTSRTGRAYGTYRVNISRWVAGWIMGREISPQEIRDTDAAHPEQTQFKGAYVHLPQGTPSEVWLAQRMESLLAYEQSHYQVTRPVSISSWPTLDPLTHPTESEEHSSEDIAAIDFAQLDTAKMPGGYFASFHAYPYYPDFINDDPIYREARDEQGTNNYLGYLRALKAHYAHMPLVIAEYGAPSSWGNAHYSPSGIHHGGHSEAQQGQHNVRMTRDLHLANTAGGMIFAWMDEWWKRTWIVDELALPREHFSRWHNLMSPEENFGLIAFDDEPRPFQTLQEDTGRIRKIQASISAGFLHLRVQLASALSVQETLVVGFDTYRDDLGETQLPGGITGSRRSEFALVLQAASQAQLYVTQAYDTYGIWHGSAGPMQRFQSTASEGAPWVPVRWQNSQDRVSKDGSMTFPLDIFPAGELRVRTASQTPSSLDAIVIQAGGIDVRIPWTLLQVTDPSELRVLHDDRRTPGRETRFSEGVALTVAVGDVVLTTPRYRWTPWQQAPATTEREKPTLAALRQIMSTLPN